MKEEIFGPVMTVYVYEDEDLDAMLKECDEGSPYALSGAIFAQDRLAIAKMEAALRNAAGNFYINDKPFGGARASGTNDKAGSMLNLIRWASPRTVKECFLPTGEITYGYMAEE